MSLPHSESDLEALIKDGVEESQMLDYKRNEALKDNVEITKDISAFANSMGGMIIYGIAEGNDDATKHRPMAITPVKRSQFSKEWLEQVINSIQPHIDVEIVSIPIKSSVDDVVYVVSIPKSNTVHQAKNKRYYKRINFACVPMDDYEIRSMMTRGAVPDIEIKVVIDFGFREFGEDFGMARFQNVQEAPYFTMIVSAHNNGAVLGNHLDGWIKIPEWFEEAIISPPFIEIGRKPSRKVLTNFLSEQIGHGMIWRTTNPQYRPIFPSLALKLLEIRLAHDMFYRRNDPFEMPWEVSCDNSGRKSGILKNDNVTIHVDERLKI